MTNILLIAYLALQASFIWARYVHFRTMGALPWGARLIEVSVVGILGAGSWLMATRGNLSPLHDLAAVLLALGSAAMFRWALASSRRKQLTAAFTPDRPIELLRTGAYAFVRNPFYLAYLMAFAIPFAATGEPWALVATAWMFLIYLKAALAEEHKFAQSPLAEAYADYAAKTGRFHPRAMTCLQAMRRPA